MTAALEEWQARGLCVTANPDVFNGPGMDVERAQRLCVQCPVRAECF